MFFISQNIHIKRSPNAKKNYEELFCNIFEFWEVESTQMEAHSEQHTPGRALGSRRGVVGCAHTAYVGWSSTSGAKKLISEKNHVKILVQSELRISRNIRNDSRPDLGNAKQKRTEREIQSRRGSCPSATMEAMDRRGNSPPL
jgi:hypothetical protein